MTKAFDQIFSNFGRHVNFFKMKRISIAFCMLLSLTATLSAQTIFLFGNQNNGPGGFFDGKDEGSYTEGTIEITMISLLGDPFNATTGGFGINQDAGGDDTDAFDFTNGSSGLTENFTISFDQDVILNSFEVSSFGASDQVLIVDDTTTVATITSSGVTLLGDYFLSASSTLNINTTAGSYGNGWEFEAITVTAAVPEPVTYALLASMLALASVMVHHRK